MIYFLLLFLLAVDMLPAQKILFLKGEPYEIGFTHGRELKDEIAFTIHAFVDAKLLANRDQPAMQIFFSAIPEVLQHIPHDYLEEMRGVADGANVPYDKIVLLNLFPEMFHCSGLIIKGEATLDQALYHVRVLDYQMGTGLQNTAVMTVVEQTGKIPFVNIGYAGFIGCVTGMNAKKIAIGEIGGKGYGDFIGLPMSFLLRQVLEQAGSIDEVKTIVESAKRTCEYFYLFSDGNTELGIAAYATSKYLEWIEPEMAYVLLEPSFVRAGDPLVLLKKNETQLDETVNFQQPFCDIKTSQMVGLLHKPLKNCLAMTGLSYPERYCVLMERVLSVYGTIDEQVLQKIIKAPVARPTNLHNAIFRPSTLEVWIAHASADGQPAYEQAYHYFKLNRLYFTG